MTGVIASPRTTVDNEAREHYGNSLFSPGKKRINGPNDRREGRPHYR